MVGRMDKQPTEIIQGGKIIEVLRSLIDSRRICKIEIPQTSFIWLTILLEIGKEGGESYLLVDGVAEFEKVLAQAGHREIALEFFEKDGVPCQFKTQVVRCQQKKIWAMLPLEIQRFQKRAFYRLTASSGTEIVWSPEAGLERKAKVRDYGMGGVAFFIDGSWAFRKEEMIRHLHLNIPQRGDDWLKIHISLAQVRRVEKNELGRETLVALEFLEVSEAMREKFGRHIFETQRLLIRKVKNILSFSRNL
jgi:c-di-GMP-binding flagellar brake protein YcgR